MQTFVYRNRHDLKDKQQDQLIKANLKSACFDITNHRQNDRYGKDDRDPHGKEIGDQT